MTKTLAHDSLEAVARDSMTEFFASGKAHHCMVCMVRTICMTCMADCPILVIHLPFGLCLIFHIITPHDVKHHVPARE